MGVLDDADAVVVAVVDAVSMECGSEAIEKY